MKVAIMQPYIFPYIGYFQLMNTVDTFVVYDNIEYTKKGWINRNRILVNGKDEYITLPLKKGSDFLQIKDRYLADGWEVERKKLLNKILASYRKAPCFSEAFPVIEKAIMFEDTNLLNFIFNSLNLVKDYLEIKTTLIISSSISIDHSLKSENKVIEICKALKAAQYINPIGGVELYNKAVFKQEGIELSFLKTDNIIYSQYQNNNFVSFLSMIDVMAFNTKDAIKQMLDKFALN
jgi:hypothetical protein